MISFWITPILADAVGATSFLAAVTDAVASSTLALTVLAAGN